MSAFGNYSELRTLDFWFKANSLTTTAPANVYVSLHTGDPGDTGANEATTGGYTRVVQTFAAASTDGSGVTTIDSNADITLGTFTGAATFTYMGIWDAASSGNFLAGGLLSSSRTVANGDQIKFSSGNITVALA
jgi:hypothetical protein